jgi:hypothetical protein
MGRTCGRFGEKKLFFAVLEGKYQGMVPLGRPRRRYEDNIKVILKKYYGGCVLDLSGSVVACFEQGKKKLGILMNRGRRGVFSTTECRCCYSISSLLVSEENKLCYFGHS